MKFKKIKFFLIYIISVTSGNIVIYAIDKIGVSKGQEAMTLINYIVLNIVIIGLSILVSFLVDNKKFDNFINKLLS